MKRRLNGPSCVQFTVETSWMAEEAVAELLARVFGRAPAIYVDQETKRVVASIYCKSLQECFPQKRAAVKAGLAWIKQCGLKIHPGRIQVAKVKREDWAESWKRHFPVLEIAPALLVKPSWSRRRPGPHQVVVELDPGLSFGTGHHPTTRFCLQQLVVERPGPSGVRRSFLDMGTGSGILAIAAAKLGYGPIEAFDSDPGAVAVAKENCRRNRVDKVFKVVRRDLQKAVSPSRQRFDLICANLSSDLLLECQEKILKRLNRGGVLVLAGILRSQFAQVKRAYEQSGFALRRGCKEKEWESGAFISAA